MHRFPPQLFFGLCSCNEILKDSLQLQQAVVFRGVIHRCAIGICAIGNEESELYVHSATVSLQVFLVYGATLNEPTCRLKAP